MHIVGRLSTEEMDEHVLVMQQQVRDSAPEMPLYGLVDWAGWRSIGEWQFQNGPHGLLYGTSPKGQPTGITGSAGADESLVEVQTVSSDVRAAVNHLRVNVEINLPGATTNFAAPPNYLDTVPDRVREFAINETPVLFEVWDAGNHSYAGGIYLGTAVVLHVRGIPLERLALCTIADLEPYLAGHRDWIRRARAESDSIE